jgi:hypothetical protein
MLFTKPYRGRGPVFRIGFAKEPFRNALQEAGRKDRSRSKISHGFAKAYCVSPAERFLGCRVASSGTNSNRSRLRLQAAVASS